MTTHPPVTKWLYSHTDYYKDGRICNYSGPSEFLPNRFQCFSYDRFLSQEYIAACHSHSNIELIYVKKGTVVSHIDGVDYTVNEGQLAVFPTNAWHYNKIYKAGTESMVALLDCDFIKSIGIDIFSCNFTPVINSADMDDIPDRIYNEVNYTPLYYWINVQLLTKELMIRLVRDFSVTKETVTATEHPKVALVKSVSSFIQTEYKKQITLEDISRHVGFNKDYISRTFKEVTKMNLWFHLNHVRCTKADQLIRTTNFPLDVIAKKCGFQTVRYLKQVYKSYHGISPDEKRKAASERR